MILGICNDPDVLSVMKLVKTVITIIKIVIPIILIVSCMIELVAAIPKAEVSEALKSIVRKIGAAIIIFLVPTFVSIIFKAIDYKEVYYPCLKNATTEGISEARKYRVESLILLAKNTLLEDYYIDAQKQLHQMEDGQEKTDLAKELDELHKDIEAAKAERENEFNKHAYTGSYTRTELMDTDEQTVKDMSNEEFIEYVAALAQDVYNEYGGVLPSITIAQACLESGYGNSFEPTSHNLYGMIGYPGELPLVTRTRKFENFYQATYYHMQYFNAYSQYYGEFNQKCKNNDALGAAEYLWKYAGGEESYPTKIKSIINTYDLTKYDN